MPVRDDYQVMLISNGGAVIRMPVEEIKRLGRSTQGVIVMRLRGDEQVSSIALVAEAAAEEEVPEAETAPVAEIAETPGNGNLQ
jgi:DNA gyrase subunit A